MREHMIPKNEEGVLIRALKKSDVDDLLEVAKKSFAEEFEISGFDPDHIREMADKVFSFWGKFLLSFLKLMGNEPFKLFVAEVEGKLVGMTMVNVEGKIGYIVAVMVHPIHRRKGIATKLVKKALNYAQKKRLGKTILHVISTNTSAKGLYQKLGFEKFESSLHLIANIDSLQRPQNVEDVQVRNFEKKDVDAVYDLIKHSKDPTHLKVFDFKKKDLEISVIKRITRFTTDKRMVAVKNDRVVGYAEASYTTSKEAGRISNICLHPSMKSKGIEDILVYAGVDNIKNVGASRIIATVLSTRQELIEKMKELGFKESFELEGMVLEFKD